MYVQWLIIVKLSGSEVQCWRKTWKNWMCTDACMIGTKWSFKSCYWESVSKEWWRMAVWCHQGLPAWQVWDLGFSLQHGGKERDSERRTEGKKMYRRQKPKVKCSKQEGLHLDGLGGSWDAQLKGCRGRDAWSLEDCVPSTLSVSSCLLAFRPQQACFIWIYHVVAAGQCA